MRGYFGIGIYQPMHDTNVGTLFRSAHAFGASFVFTVGRRYRTQSSDTSNARLHVPYLHYESTDDLVSRIPVDSTLVCVEMVEAHSLPGFTHPERAVYLLGNERTGVPTKLLERSVKVVIPTRYCLNVASAGTVVLYDRIAKLK